MQLIHGKHVGLLEPKIGKGNYVLVLVEYEKIKRIIIPLGDNHLLFMTPESGADQLKITNGVRALNPQYVSFQHRQICYYIKICCQEYSIVEMQNKRYKIWVVSPFVPSSVMILIFNIVSVSVRCHTSGLQKL